MQIVSNGAKGHHTFSLNVNEEAITLEDIINNRSRVKAVLQISRLSGKYNWEEWGEAIKWHVDIGGQSRDGSIPDYDGLSTVTLLEETFTIEHSNDGSKRINVSFSINDTADQYYTCGDASGNGEMELSTIPRTTALPDLSGDIESSYSIPLNPASSNFTHSLAINTSGTTWQYVNSSGNLQTSEYKFTNPTIPLKIPSSFYSLFTGKSIELNMRLNTYNGTALIGSSTATLTANCNATKCSPYFTGTVEDSNSVTAALTGNKSKIIKGFSNALVTLSSLRASYSTNDTNNRITARRIGGVTVSGSTRTITGATSSTFVVVIENSRGFSTQLTVGKSSNLINYFSPSLSIKPDRTSQTSDTVKLTYSGSFFNQSFGSVANAISSLKWFYKQSSASSWTEGGTITPTLSGNTIKEATISLNGTFTYTNNYRFKVECTDKLSTGIKEEALPAGVPNYSHGKGWFQHHTPIYQVSGNVVPDIEVIEEWEE